LGPDKPETGTGGIISISGSGREETPYVRLSHNKRYDALQEAYIETRDSGLLEQMYGIARKAAHNYINAYCRKRGLQTHSLLEKSHDSAMYVIEQYLRKPHFSVKRISAYIHFGVLKTLFRDKDVETRETSYDQLIKDGKIR
jgi:hypothetical protein